MSPNNHRGPAPLLYALATFASAFLLFQVQPLIAKIILPWFGGGAAVWIVCLLFFQVVLLLGYAYAHAVVRYLKPGAQTAVHGVLLLASLAVLPVYPSPAFKPTSATDPTWRILSVLGLTVGLPYFLLSATGPLLQAWYAREHKGALPYRLYSLSNAGSMFALLSYPVLFEPRLTTHEQAGTWSIAYGLFVLLCGYMALRARVFPVLGAATGAVSAKKPEAPQYLMWLLLPFTASVLLLAITNHISQNVAAIPFLWILPLSLYLLSFILCFESSGWYRRNPYLQLLAVALGGMAYGITVDSSGNMPIWWNLVLFGLGLFTCCMVCHGELARLKPDPKYLTHFYLTIAAGGALGGIFVGLIAPHVFQSFYELQLGLVLCAVLLLFALSLDPETVEWFRGWRIAAPLAGAIATVIMGVYMGQNIRLQAMNSLVLERNFYGALRVRDNGPDDGLNTVRTLTNGTINHGEEYVNVAKRRMATTYYGPNTGVGMAIREKQKKGAIRVGVVGLGTGTLAAYGRLGDYFRYYEINPLVPPITQGQFWFVPYCPAKLDIAMGDARLSLEREAPENFDILVVDAFSSDAIPVHLLTKQAFELYWRHLKPGGVLAVHVSNKYLDLGPVVALGAAATGKQAMLVSNEADDEREIAASDWVLVSSRPGFFDEPMVRAAATKIQPIPGLRAWTDDFSNLYKILR